MHHRHRHLVDRVQHTVDAETDHALVAARLQVDVAGALVEGVLPEPVHHLHHVLVVGVQLLGLAQLDQLLEAAKGIALVAHLAGRAHRLRQRKELGDVAHHVLRRRDHQPHTLSGLPLDLGNPVDHKRLRRRHHHLGRADLHRQHLVALGVGRAHHVAHLAHIDLERIDAEILQSTALGQPLRQHLDVHHLRVGLPHHADHCQPHQWVLRAVRRGTAGDRARGLVGRDHTVVAQPAHQDAPVQRTEHGVFRGSGLVGGFHAGLIQPV
jgi:hypothetical protein